MKQSYKVSVVIPVYNVENYLQQCVNSVLNQTYQNLEIILVDDGSMDRSPAICDEYAAKDSRILVIHKRNGGASSARNQGICAATGAYILFLDSDDYLAPHAVECYMTAALQDNADVVCSGYATFGGSSKQYEATTAVLHHGDIIGHYFEYAGKYINYASWAKLFRMEVLSSNHILYHESQLCCKDHTFNVTVYRHCNTVSVIKEALYFYNDCNEGSLSKRYLQDYGTYRILEFKTVLAWLNENDLSNAPVAKAQAAKFIICILNYYGRYLDKKTAASFIQKYTLQLCDVYPITPIELNQALGIKLFRSIQDDDYSHILDKWKMHRRMNRILQFFRK